MTIGTAQEKPTANEVSKIVLDAAMKVHSVLGPGLLESTCEACLVEELRNAGRFVMGDSWL